MIRIALAVLLVISSTVVAPAQTRDVLKPSATATFSALAAREEITLAQARKSDSLINGALIGAGVAVGAGLLLCNLTEPWENCRDDVGPMLGMAALGAGIGIGIDALIRRDHTLAVPPKSGGTLRARPVIGRGTRGLQMSVQF